MPDPDVVRTVHLAVRRELVDLQPGLPIVVACSGGADSLALLEAAVHVTRPLGLPVVGVTVDHGLQEGSAAHAQRVVGQMADPIAADRTVLARATVEADAGLGPEAAARRARYAVLEEVARQVDATAVLLGHTRDDQAETVLLGLARGAGGRSVAGMRRRFDLFRRPLLDVGRAETEAFCRAEGLDFWEDPHNADPRFTRARVRHRVLPVLEEELGPGVASTLARTADLLRPDMEALDQWADAAFAEVLAGVGNDHHALSLAGLAGLPEAIRTRVLRRTAVDAGAIDAELFHVHVRALADLAAGLVHGVVQLPGPVTARLERDRLVLERPAEPG